MSRNQLWGQSAQYLMIKGAAAAIGLLGFVVFTRLLSTDQYGQYSLVITAVGLVNLIAFNWIKLGVLRFYPAHRDEPDELLSTVAGLFLQCFLGVALLTAVVALLWSGMPLRRYLLVAGFLLAGQAWLQVNLEIARSELDPRRYGWLTMSRATIGVVVAAGLAFAGQGPGAVVLGLAVGHIAPSLYLMRPIWSGVRPRSFRKSLLREILAYGIPLSITASLAFILAGSDRFMIAALLGDAEAGLYSAAYDLGHHVLSTICMTVGLAGTPLVINALERGGWDRAREQYVRNGSLLLALAVPASLGLIVIAPELIGLVLGSAFHAGASTVFPWVVLGVCFQCLKFYYLDSAFFLHKATRIQVWIVLPAAVLNIALNALFLPRVGIVAAAWSTAASYLLALVMTLFYVQRRLRMPVPWNQALRVAAAGAVMVAALVGLRRIGYSHLAVQLPVGAAVYVTATWFLGVEDVRAAIATIAERFGGRKGAS